MPASYAFFFAPLQQQIKDMTNEIKGLVGQTAIYGLSSILGRLLNYLLVPLYTNYFLTHEFGVITLMYSYVAILIVVITHGMETTFFRFNEREQFGRETVFGTSLLSVLSFALFFLLLALSFRGEIASFLQYPDNTEYVIWFAIIISIDALSAIPFAKLRAQNKAFRFAFVKLLGIGVNIFLVLFFVVFAPMIVSREGSAMANIVATFYNPGIGVGYVFIANLVASSITLLLLLPVIFRSEIRFSMGVWKEMISYALPLLVAGLAGVLNEALDKPLLQRLLPEDIAMSHLGIYGACYRVSVLMILFIQAFRFAAEPFFFAQYKNENAQLLYARVMKIFVITCLFIFLGIMLYMDIIQYFIGKDFREGLDIVPILLMAHIFLGIYFNLSIWYKLTGQTRFGAYIAVIGAFITIAVNVIFIPIAGYYASAWGHLVCYLCMTLISWYWGRKHYPIAYDIPRIFLFIISALMLYGLHSLVPETTRVAGWFISAAFLGVFAFSVLAIDREARETIIPALLKLLKR